MQGAASKLAFDWFTSFVDSLEENVETAADAIDTASSSTSARASTGGQVSQLKTLADFSLTMHVAIVF